MSGSVLGPGAAAVNKMDKKTVLSKVTFPHRLVSITLLCLPGTINIRNAYVFVDKSPFLLPGLQS